MGITSSLTGKSPINQGFPSQKEVQEIKNHFREGCRIRLIRMADQLAPVPDGMTGTVEYVDDAGQVHMNWDNGRTLALIPSEDEYEIIS